jgi:hypothetical protein
MINSTEVSTRNQKGGLVLLNKYGLSHFSEIGKMGGRPKYEDTLPKIPQNNKNIEIGGLPGKANLETLRELWKQQNMGAGNSQSGSA